VEQLLAAHRDGATAGATHLGARNLELWYRTFIDGEGAQTLPEPHQRTPNHRTTNPEPPDPDPGSRSREDSHSMRVAVFGLGYVEAYRPRTSPRTATMSSASTSIPTGRRDHAGRSPIVEPGLEDLLKAGIDARRLRATTSTAEAIAETDLSLICRRARRSRKNGSLDLSYLIRVCEQIGDALKEKTTYHVVVVRSTVLPGTTHEHVIPTLEARSGKTYGEGSACP